MECLLCGRWPLDEAEATAIDTGKELGRVGVCTEPCAEVLEARLHYWPDAPPLITRANLSPRARREAETTRRPA